MNFNFNFNFFDYIKQAVPFFLRKEKMLAYLETLLKPIQILNDDFGAYVPATRKKANQTGQVAYLERLLNDEFDSTLRRIYIDDGQENVLPPFVFNKVEDRPIYIYNKAEAEDSFFIYNQSEFFTEPDFIVFVPAAILGPALQILIERQVNQYKQAGKIYEVQSF
jgi:hypothetical protein